MSEDGELSAVPTTNYHIRLITGNANRKLAEDISGELGIPLDECTVGTFADGEINIHIRHNIRGADTFIIQPTCKDVNKNLMELLLLIHTLRLSSAKRITAVVPYFGYARQDRKTKPRVPISAAAVAQLIEAMRPHRIVTIDLHCGQIQGFFHNTPVDNLFADDVFVTSLKALNLPSEQLVIVSPDAGGVARAR
jgi:ribose-phosphate pyrophosphokinase